MAQLSGHHCSSRSLGGPESCQVTALPSFSTWSKLVPTPCGFLLARRGRRAHTALLTSCRREASHMLTPSLQGMLGIAVRLWAQDGEKNRAGSAQGSLCHVPHSVSAPAHLEPHHYSSYSQTYMSFSAGGLLSTCSLPSFIQQTAIECLEPGAGDTDSSDMIQCGAGNTTGPLASNQHGTQCTGFLGTFLFFFKLIYLFLVALGLRCCPQAFSSCGERGLLLVVMHGLLTARASVVAARGL